MFCNMFFPLRFNNVLNGNSFVHRLEREGGLGMRLVLKYLYWGVKSILILITYWYVLGEDCIEG